MNKTEVFLFHLIHQKIHQKKQWVLLLGHYTDIPEFKSKYQDIRRHFEPNPQVILYFIHLYHFYSEGEPLRRLHLCD